MNNIILVGMPGSGKSTLGIILARRLGYGYLDTDSFISQREKNTLQGIIDSKGLDYFLETESQVGREIICDRVVIATGGSMIMSEEAMKNLCSLGTVIYIDVALSELKKRLGNYADRGVACKKGETLEEILKRREPLYKKHSDIKVTYKSGDSLEETVDSIITKLKA